MRTVFREKIVKAPSVLCISNIIKFLKVETDRKFPTFKFQQKNPIFNGSKIEVSEPEFSTSNPDCINIQKAYKSDQFKFASYLESKT